MILHMYVAGKHGTVPTYWYQYGSIVGCQEGYQRKGRVGYVGRYLKYLPTYIGRYRYLSNRLALLCTLSAYFDTVHVRVK